jgi:hypothetical protein
MLSGAYGESVVQSGGNVLACARSRAEEVPEFFVAAGEYEAVDQEHLGQIPQAGFLRVPPKRHERYHINRISRPVQQAAAQFVGLFAQS